jgi:uncharacterized protein (DUF1778 family)
MVQTAERTGIRNQAINIRASRQQRNLIDQAARILGKSRSEFMLDVAYREATNVLLDQTVFFLDDEAFDQFQKMLDNPPPPSDALRKLLLRKPRWE